MLTSQLEHKKSYLVEGVVISVLHDAMEYELAANMRKEDEIKPTRK